MKSAWHELSNTARIRLLDEFSDSYMKPDLLRGDWLELICYEKIYYAPFSDYAVSEQRARPVYYNKVGARLASVPNKNSTYSAYGTDWKLYDTAEEAADDLMAIYGRYL